MKKLSFLSLTILFVTALLVFQSAPTTTTAETYRKLLAPANTLDAQQPGIELWHDYGAFALYRLTATAWQSLTPQQQAQTQSLAHTNQIMLDAYPFDTSRDALTIPPHLKTTSPADYTLSLIQFVGPIKDEWLTAVRHTGATPIHYIDHNAYLVWTTPDSRQQLTTLAQDGHFLQYNGPYHPYFKLDPTLRQQLTLPNLQAEPITINVQLFQHKDNTTTKNLLNQLASAQTTPWHTVLNYENAAFTLTLDQIITLAHQPDVTALGIIGSPRLLDEAQAQILAGNFNAAGDGPDSPGYLNWLLDLGFSTDPADYPIVNFNDDGLGDGSATGGDTTLHQFGNPANASRVAYIQNCTDQVDGRGIGGHGHINASIAGGYDDRTGFPYQDADGYRLGLGISPFTRLAATRLFDPSGFDISRCNNDYTYFIRTNYLLGTRISSNSWGDDASIGTYAFDSQLFDASVRDADTITAGNQQQIFIFGAGNSGPNPNTILTPGNGKNVITVGAVENPRPTWTDGCLIDAGGADSAMDIINFSSRGPAPGNRIKPEIVAPGTHVQGTASPTIDYTGATVCDQYHPSGQSIFAASSGTSHATPSVTGAASLYYYWLETRYGITNPSAALIKSYLIAHPTYVTGQSANDTLPSNVQGYGIPNLGNGLSDTPRHVFEQSADTTFDNTGETWTLVTQVSDPDQPLRISMAYTDKPGVVNSSNPQVNNLDLSVNINGTNYIGNRFVGAWSTIGGIPDSANNYESVFLPAGTTGIITITVTATNIADDGVPNSGDTTDQDFALVCFNCAQLALQPAVEQACIPQDANFNFIIVPPTGISGNLNFNLTGIPTNTVSTVTPNSLTPPGNGTVTITNTAATSAGEYTLNLTASNISGTLTATSKLRLFDTPPGNASLLTPTNSITNSNMLTTFHWLPATEAVSYTFQLATDDAFTNIIEEAVTSKTNHRNNVILDPETTYYWRIITHNPCGQQTSNTYSFTTAALRELLLVDDDGETFGDARGVYINALNALGQTYDTWHVAGVGIEPTVETLIKYKAIIWFSGDGFGFLPPTIPPQAGPGPTGEANLTTYLDSGNGRCFFLSSQEYYLDWGLTSFMVNYLGVQAVAQNQLYSSVTGVGPVYGGLGPYTRSSNSLFNAPDRVEPNATAERAFTYSGLGAGIMKTTPNYFTTFVGFALKDIQTSAGRAAILGAFLDQCFGVAVAPTMDITMTPPNTAQISWDDPAENCAYHLYQHDTPYQDPTLGNLLTTITSPDPMIYTHTLTMPLNFYSLQADSCGGVATANATNNVADFRFNLTPGTP
ncbi:MAG TPA: S8 family serine peptidase [Anaerolineae bacterium]|nr:S8 family serine peptidase [Anaerolineae bacterium]